MHDDLTRLSSRKSFFDDLRLLTSHDSNMGNIACLIINIHDLNRINSSLGYNTGDKLIKAFAERLRDMLKETDIAARIGGNKFALLLTSIMNSGHATLAANKVLMILDEPLSIDDDKISIKVSIGIALYPEHANDAETLLHNTEIALNQAKTTNCDYKLYCKDSDSTKQGDLILEKELKNAIEDNQLVMHYQPQISLLDQRPCGIEALVRWQHPVNGVIPPDRFITLAESCGLIVPLTIWTLNTTLRHCSPCFEHKEDFNVSINLSAALLHEPDLVDIITQSMQIWGTKPNSLMLEVTESAMMINPEQSLQTLTKLHQAGINISIDDFGTGHSSLAYLKQLPVNELKIDKSFVMNMTDNPDDRKIVHSIIDLGHNFDLKVVAEGIESEQVLSELAALGCDIGQGYFIGKPMPLIQLQHWMNKLLPKKVLPQPIKTKINNH